MSDRGPDDRDSSKSASGSMRLDVITVAMVGLGILMALAVLAIFRTAPDALTALSIGVVFALALDPVLRATQRRLRCSRAIGTVIVGIGLTTLLGGTLLLLGPPAADQASEFADELPATIEAFYDWPLVGEPLENADAIGRAERFVDDLPNRINADTITSAADRFVSNAATILLVLVTAIAVLFDGEALVARVRRLVPPENRERADEVGRIVYQSVARYFAGSVSVALLNGIVVLIAGLVLGVPLAPLAAIWAALTNLIPQIGGFLGGAFFVVLALTQGPLVGVIALVVFLAYQQTENNVIQPLVIGRAVDLSPPTTMLAALIGGAAAGVPGALVATPMIGAVKSVWMSTHATDESDSDGESDGDSDGDDDDSTILSRLLSRLRPGH
ncbi:AI-2E family transporter [Ilumatobacter sp.]|uniref:AI-2E family transporter n=1 Tax=Ilumatobacter sp. TaxID=1967498 RepID=UPI003C314116